MRPKRQQSQNELRSLITSNNVLLAVGMVVGEVVLAAAATMQGQMQVVEGSTAEATKTTSAAEDARMVSDGAPARRSAHDRLLCQTTLSDTACLKCGSTEHQVRECPNCQQGETVQLLKASRERYKPVRNLAARRFDVVDNGRPLPAEDSVCGDPDTVEATVDGVVVTAHLLGSGAEASLGARGVVDALEDAGKCVVLNVEDNVQLTPVGGKVINVTRKATFSEVVLTTSAGPLMLRNLTCYVEEANTSLDLIVGRPIMRLLGYSTDRLLVEARDTSTDREVGEARSGEGVRAPSALQRMCRLQVATRDPPMAEAEAENVERYEMRTALPTMHSSTVDEVISHLDRKIEVATSMGLTLHGQTKLKAVVQLRADCFRLEFGNDPPVRVPPMQVHLKPDARPVRAQPRRYSPNDRAFLDRHTAPLLSHGLIFRNHRSRWASAPRIVRQREQDTDPNADPRMTIDTREVNERTEPMPWPMSVIDVVLGELEGARVFFVLDWFRSYWQLPLHPDSQEIYSFVTHRGIYTPTRVPMGATDAVAYCQGVVEEIFGDLVGNGILAWLDDILGNAADEASLLEILDQVLSRCQEYGLKLHAKKCQLSTTEVKWCGRIISATGVKHCPERVQGLVEMQSPRTAAELQQYLCAINWMRQSIPEYTTLTASLYDVLDRAAKAASSRKKRALAKILLSNVGWGPKEVASFEDVRSALLHMVPLAHPSPAAEVCPYSDASQEFWGQSLPSWSRMNYCYLWRSSSTGRWHSSAGDSWVQRRAGRQLKGGFCYHRGHSSTGVSIAETQRIPSVHRPSQAGVHI